VRAVGEHPVLVDPRLVGEGVSPDDRLVVLHRIAGQARDEPARARQLLGAHRRRHGRELVGADRERHDHLLERGVAGPLAEAVDAHLDLAAHRPARPRGVLAVARPRSLWQCVDST
jgi:hypothetical protein